MITLISHMHTLVGKVPNAAWQLIPKQPLVMVDNQQIVILIMLKQQSAVGYGYFLTWGKCTMYGYRSAFVAPLGKGTLCIHSITCSKLLTLGTCTRVNLCVCPHVMASVRPAVQLLQIQEVHMPLHFYCTKILLFTSCVFYRLYTGHISSSRLQTKSGDR